MSSTAALFLLAVAMTVVASSVHNRNTTECPASPPCTCQYNNILCGGLNLTYIPQILKPTTNYSWSVYLDRNNFVHIPGRVFENITMRDISLVDNQIVSIADDAFTGSENTMTMLALTNNSLTEIPSALGILVNLRMLLVAQNPLISFNVDNLGNISSSLTVLVIGSASMTSWPSGIGVLKSLGNLDLKDLPYRSLPNNAFKGLESVTMLQIERTKIQTLSGILHSFTGLKSLMLTDNAELTSDGFNNETFSGLRSLNDILIRNSPLTLVPDFSAVTPLLSLSLSLTNITSWDDRKTLPQTTVISSAELSNSPITRVPDVFKNIESLASVALWGTNITHIVADDFKGLNNLVYLSLGGSPVKNISDQVFKDNPLISQLNMINTNLTQFPRAVEHLVNVQDVNVIGDPIQCTCESMGWIKSWNRSKTIYWGADGECVNHPGVYLEDYIKHYVPKCHNS